MPNEEDVKNKIVEMSEALTSDPAVFRVASNFDAEWAKVQNDPQWTEEQRFEILQGVTMELVEHNYSIQTSFDTIGRDNPCSARATKVLLDHVGEEFSTSVKRDMDDLIMARSNQIKSKEISVQYTESNTVDENSLRTLQKLSAQTQDIVSSNLQKEEAKGVRDTLSQLSKAAVKGLEKNPHLEHTPENKAKVAKAVAVDALYLRTASAALLSPSEGVNHNEDQQKTRAILTQTFQAVANQGLTGQLSENKVLPNEIAKTQNPELLSEMAGAISKGENISKYSTQKTLTKVQELEAEILRQKDRVAQLLDMQANHESRNRDLGQKVKDLLRYGGADKQSEIDHRLKEIQKLESRHLALTNPKLYQDKWEEAFVRNLQGSGLPVPISRTTVRDSVGDTTSKSNSVNSPGAKVK